MKAPDATQAIREKAAAFANVDQGTSCTQSSFKTGGKAFLFIGEQGGRYKAMFKLDRYRLQAEKLAHDNPDDYQVGSSIWVTVRFSDQKPLPKRIWSKWLDESYRMTVSPNPSGQKRTKKNKTAKKTTAGNKKTAKKTAKKKRATASAVKKKRER
ncbi:MAG: MmcQ/YjbR family DNA-binding protein [Planctomycetota bacterium]